MKNADMPAMPNSNTETYPTPTPVQWGQGLTKRETFAMHAMQGILSGNILVELTSIPVTNFADDVGDVIASMAVNAADALLAELEK